MTKYIAGYYNQHLTFALYILHLALAVSCNSTFLKDEGKINTILFPKNSLVYIR
jgi:hypothetical protein